MWEKLPYPRDLFSFISGAAKRHVGLIVLEKRDITHIRVLSRFFYILVQTSIEYAEDGLGASITKHDISLSPVFVKLNTSFPLQCITSP